MEPQGGECWVRVRVRVRVRVGAAGWRVMG